MIAFTVIFYMLAILILVATLMAITRRDALHAVVYLILSFIATGLIFYLLGAPFLALLEVILYAGAIMVLFLFIVMMLRLNREDRRGEAFLTRWSPAIVMGGITFILAATMVFSEPASRTPLRASMAGAMELGRFLFQKYWFPVEIASFLLLVALVGALYLGRYEKKSKEISTREGP